MHLPFLPDSNAAQTFARLIGNEVTPTRFVFTVFTADGTRAGSYPVVVPPAELGAVHHVNAGYLRAQGAPRGPWSAYLDISPPPLFLPAVFLRTPNGFVTPIHMTGTWLPPELLQALSAASGLDFSYGEFQRTLNPGRNTEQVGMLHIAAMNQPVDVLIVGWDDTGNAARVAIGHTGRIEAHARRTYTSAQLEQAAGVTGAGKWRLLLVAAAPFSSQTGIHLRNLNIYSASAPQAAPRSWRLETSTTAPSPRTWGKSMRRDARSPDAGETAWIESLISTMGSVQMDDLPIIGGGGPLPGCHSDCATQEDTPPALRLGRSHRLCSHLTGCVEVRNPSDAQASGASLRWEREEHVDIGFAPREWMPAVLIPTIEPGAQAHVQAAAPPSGRAFHTKRRVCLFAEGVTEPHECSRWYHDQRF